MKEILYPFQRGGLHADDAASLRLSIRRWALELQLDHASSSLEDFSFVFTKRCGPSVTWPETISLAALFMYVLSHLNDRAGLENVRPAVVALKQGLFAGRRTGKLSRAGAYLRQHLNQQSTPRDQRAFLGSFNETLESFSEESQRANRTASTQEAYTRLRRRTIAVTPFLELWKMAATSRGMRSKCARAQMNRLEVLCCDIIFFANDLHSTERDLRLGQQNLVLLLAEGHKSKVAECSARVRAEHDSKVNVAATECARIRANFPHERWLHWHLDLLEGCVVGNLLAMRELSSRYKKTEQISTVGAC